MRPALNLNKDFTHKHTVQLLQHLKKRSVLTPPSKITRLRISSEVGQRPACTRLEGEPGIIAHGVKTHRITFAMDMNHRCPPQKGLPI